MINTMNAMRILLVANELRSYREAIAQVFEKLRPEIEFYETEPENLNWEVTRLRPDFVVCSQVTSMVESCVPVWVELYPDCEAHSVVSIRGETTTVDDIQLTDLLEILDRTEDLAHLG